MVVALADIAMGLATRQRPLLPLAVVGLALLGGCIVRVPRKDCSPPELEDDVEELAFALCRKLTGTTGFRECLAAQQRIGALPPEDVDLDGLARRLLRLKRKGRITGHAFSDDGVTLVLELPSGQEARGPQDCAPGARPEAPLLAELPDCRADWEFPFFIPMHQPREPRLVDFHFCYVRRRFDRDVCVELRRDGAVVARDCAHGP